MANAQIYHSISSESTKPHNNLTVVDLLEKVNTPKNPLIVINSAMTYAQHLQSYQANHPSHYFDFGIVEEHSAVISSILARAGHRVYLTYYSTFFQRIWDQLINDIKRVDAKVVLGIDAIGFNAYNGSTHQGLFDLGMLYAANIKIYCPRNLNEAYFIMDDFYSSDQKGIIAVRMIKEMSQSSHPLVKQKPKAVAFSPASCEAKAYIIGYGRSVDYAIKYVTDNKLNIGVLNCYQLNPIAEDILKLVEDKNIIVYEESYYRVSLYQEIVTFLYENHLNNRVIQVSVKEPFVASASLDDLFNNSKLWTTPLDEAIKLLDK
jgi:1-deoxy-D-xylulose-5-phosphate synthase